MIIGLSLGLSLPLATPARADPLGFLVNKIMEHIIDNIGKNTPQEQNQSAYSPFRTLPQNSQAGTMSPPQGMVTEIDGKEYKLASNIRIRDENNRIVMPMYIKNSKRVRYVLNTQNQVEKVWMLTPKEH